VDFSLGFHVDARKGITVVRMIGGLRIEAVGVGGSVEVAAGITMVRANAQLPDPQLTVEEPWMWWLNDTVLPASDSGQYRPIDVKSMRKFVDQDRRLMFIVKNHDAVETLSFSLGVRVLYKLP